MIHIYCREFGKHKYGGESRKLLSVCQQVINISCFFLSLITENLCNIINTTANSAHGGMCTWLTRDASQESTDLKPWNELRTVISVFSVIYLF